MQRDNRGKQFHGDGQRPKCTLHANPGQSEGRPPRGNLRAPPLGPTDQSQRQNQYADPSRQVAVNHLNPSFWVSHRPAWHSALRRVDLQLRTDWAGVAVAARPVGAAQARVSQPSKGAENHQIKS